MVKVKKYIILFVLSSIYISTKAFATDDCKTEKQEIVFLKKQLEAKPQSIVFNLSLTDLDKSYNNKNISQYNKNKKILAKMSDYKRLYLAHSLLIEKKNLTNIKKVLDFKSDILAVEYMRQIALSEIYFLDKNFKKSKDLIESILLILNSNTKEDFKPYSVDFAKDSFLVTLADLHLRLGIFNQQFFIKTEKSLPNYNIYENDLIVYLQLLKSPFLTNNKYLHLSKKVYEECPYNYGNFDTYVNNLFYNSLLKEAKTHILKGLKNFTYIDIEIYIILVRIYINERSYKKAIKLIEKIEKYEDIGLYYQEQIKALKVLIKNLKTNKKPLLQRLFS